MPTLSILCSREMPLKINKSKLDQLVVTDTIPLSDSAKACKKIRVISLAPTLAEAIRRVNNEESISAMFL